NNGGDVRGKWTSSQVSGGAMSRVEKIGRRWALAVVLLGAFGVFGCGGASAGRGEATGPRDTLEFVPANAFALARVSVASLRKSPYFELLEGHYKDSGEADLELLRIVAGVDHVLLAVSPNGDGGELSATMVVRGDFKPNEVLSFLQAKAKEESGALQVEQRGAYRIVRIDEEVAAVEIGTHTWVVVEPANLDATLARIANPAAGAPVLEALRKESAFGTHDVDVVADMKRSGLSGQVAPGGGPALEEVERVSAHLDLRSGIRGEGTLAFADAARAAAFAEDLRTRLATLRKSQVTTILGLGSVIDGVVVTAAEKDFLVRVDVADAEVQRLIGRLSGMLGMLMAATDTADLP
ncbi:MAG: hypothetical protein KC416_14110, partial [Myxococcales bacterium]|nr:hypothetical protein [Myxococcales bacterium]